MAEIDRASLGIERNLSQSQEETSYNRTDSHDEMVHGRRKLFNIVLGSQTSSASSIGDQICDFPITPPKLKNVLLSAVNAVIYPALIILSGLSTSGKTEFLCNLFRNNMKLSSHFSQYSIVSGGFMSSLSKTRSLHVQTVLEYSFVSGLYHYCRMEGLKPVFDNVSGPVCQSPPGDIFCNDLLQKTLTHLCTWIKELNEDPKMQDSDRRHFIPFEGTLHKGMAEICLWELTINRTSLRFLECFRGQLYNSHVWLFVDLEQNIDKLHLPPEPSTNDHPCAMQWRSRLHYLMRSSCLSEMFGIKRSKVCRIIAIHGDTTDSTLLKQMLSKLQEEAENAALQYGLSHLFDFEIIPVNRSSEKAQKEAYDMFASYLPTLQVKEISLSWTFLRLALDSSQSVFMECEKIREIAKELNVNINLFLKHYTSFGSLLNMKIVDDKSRWVILQPAKFLENVCRLLSESSAEYGIITPSMASKIFGHESEIYFSILSSVHLVSVVTRDRLSDELISKCDITDDIQSVYYMSVIRQEEPDKESLPTAIQMVIGLKSPSMIMQMPFTNYLLKLLPEAVLAPCKSVNVTRIQIPNKIEIKVVFQADVIEIRLDNPQCIDILSNACSMVIKAIQRIAAIRAKRGGEFSYYLRTQCVCKTEESSNLMDSEKYHVLNDELFGSCGKCSDQFKSTGFNVHQYFKIALQKVINPQYPFYKAIANISADDALSCAKEIHKLSDAELLSQVLGVTSSFQFGDDTIWLKAFTTIMSWREVSQDKSKRQLAIQLLQAANNEGLKQEQIELLKKLARNLDIQVYSKAMQRKEKINNDYISPAVVQSTVAT